jgi:hypothetical protein
LLFCRFLQGQRRPGLQPRGSISRSKPVAPIIDIIPQKLHIEVRESSRVQLLSMRHSKNLFLEFALTFLARFVTIQASLEAIVGNPHH